MIRFRDKFECYVSRRVFNVIYYGYSQNCCLNLSKHLIEILSYKVRFKFNLTLTFKFGI
jgi:hypothetical protein